MTKTFEAGDRVRCVIPDSFAGWQAHPGDVVTVEVGNAATFSDTKGYIFFNDNFERVRDEAAQPAPPSTPDYLAKAKKYVRKNLVDSDVGNEEWNAGFSDGIIDMLREVFGVHVRFAKTVTFSDEPR